MEGKKADFRDNQQVRGKSAAEIYADVSAGYVEDGVYLGKYGSELLCAKHRQTCSTSWRKTRSGIIRTNRLYSDHTSNSAEADTSTSLELVLGRSPIASGTRQSSEISFRTGHGFPPKRRNRRRSDVTILRVSFFVTSVARFRRAYAMAHAPPPSSTSNRITAENTSYFTVLQLGD